MKSRPRSHFGRLSFLNTSNLLVDPIGIPNGQAPRLFSNHRGFPYIPSVPEPIPDHLARSNNHQRDMTAHSSIELAEEGVQK